MLKGIHKIININKIAITIWGYFCILVFIFNSLSFVSNGNKRLAIITICLSVSYFVLLTLSLHLSLKENKNEEIKNKLHNVNFIKKILKLIMTVLIVMFTTGLFSPKSLLKRLNIAWILITILLDILYYCLSYIIRKIKN